MELHELHVRELHAGAVRDREAVAGRDDGVRRVAIDLTAAAGREHGGVGDDLDRAAGDARAHAAAAAAIDDEIEDTRLLEDGDALALLHARAQRARDFGAGLIAVRVHDAIARVRRFLAELELAVGAEVEACAGGLQLAHARGPFLDEHLDGGGVA